MKVIIFPVNVVLLFFFFPSRRRHTSWPRDWSSDVCSSDLAARSRSKPQSTSTVLVDCGFDRERAAAKGRFQQTHPLELQIGRASCRERAWGSVVEVVVKEQRLRDELCFINAVMS